MACDLDDCFQTVIDVSRKAGVMIREAFNQEKRIEIKSSAADLVTETDQKVEELIIKTLKDKFPTHRFIGEESVAAGEKVVWTDDPTWIIDPVDGTTNFVHRFPFVAISIGLTVNKVTEIGVVYNPILDQMYTARRGKGAFCNDEKLQVSKTDEMSDSLICAEFGSGRDEAIMDSKFRTMKKIIMKCHGIRSIGSAALTMCFVAGGNVNGYHEYGVHCWDIAAGALIVTEAGGVLMDAKGGEFDMMSRRVLCAGTEKLARQLVECIEPIELERD